MNSLRTRSSNSSRGVIGLALVLVVTLGYGHVAVGQSQQDDATGVSVMDLTWPSGVELLAGQDLTLDDGDYQWRITLGTATSDAEEPIETGRGIVIAVTGAILVQGNDEDVVRLNSGAARNVHEEDTILIVSAGEAPADFLLIELVPDADADTDDPAASFVGPLTVPDGSYALVLLNLPADTTSDMAAEQVIGSALRPGVSIAYTEDGIPERLEEDEAYDRFIVALYPPEPLVTPTPVPTEPPPTPVPPQPTVPPTAVPTATTAPEPSPTATSEPTVTPEPTATAEPEPTEPAIPTPVPPRTPEPPVIRTPVPPDIGGDD